MPTGFSAPSLIPRLLNQVSCAERADTRGCELGKKRSRLHDRDEDVSCRLVLGTLLGLPAPRFLGEGRALGSTSLSCSCRVPHASNAAASCLCGGVRPPPRRSAPLTRHHRIRTPRRRCFRPCRRRSCDRHPHRAWCPLPPLPFALLLYFALLLSEPFLSSRAPDLPSSSPPRCCPRVFIASSAAAAAAGDLPPVSALPQVECTPGIPRRSAPASPIPDTPGAGTWRPGGWGTGKW